MAGRERHQSLDRGLALSVDPVKILQKQYRRPRRDHLFDRMAHGIDNGPPPQQRFQFVPAGIVDGLVENSAKGSRPKIGMCRSEALRRFRFACGRNIAHLQRALKQLLQQGERDGLLQRVALRFQDLPVLLPQPADEFVSHPGFSDPRRAHQRDNLSKRTYIPRRPLQQGHLFRAADERGKALG
ncbi:MAG: hypothetical protein P4M05_07570 [Bradyrhizobium sp.]|nr:hypothetical protein [Bradyrhizobium sp.]